MESKASNVIVTPPVADAETDADAADAGGVCFESPDEATTRANASNTIRASCCWNDDGCDEEAEDGVASRGNRGSS